MNSEEIEKFMARREIKFAKDIEEKIVVPLQNRITMLEKRVEKLEARLQSSLM